MIKSIKKTANFFSLLDSEGRLSITNVAVIIVLAKLAISPSASITEAGSLLVVLANYAHKRITNNQASDKTEDVQNQINSAINLNSKQLESLESKVSALAISAGMKSS
jgi:hypothetical protein